MPAIEIKAEYRGIAEISARLGKNPRFATTLIKRKQDPLPVKKIGRELWITEKKLQEWLNR